jgi:hypothetical protein
MQDFDMNTITADFIDMHGDWYKSWFLNILEGVGGQL